MIIMPTARKLPSGSWRCLVFSHNEPLFDKRGKPIIDPKTGKQKEKRVYESFTCDDPSRSGKRTAEAMAAQFAATREKRNLPVSRLTFGEALEKYIEERSQILSPSTIRKYRSMQRNCMKPLENYRDIANREVMAEVIRRYIDTQHTLGMSEVEAGVLLTPWPLATMVSAPLAGKLIERVHAGVLGCVGLVLLSGGLFLLAILADASPVWEIALFIGLCGFGFGLFQTPNNSILISSAPPARSGGASGMLGMARLIGQTIGTTSVAIVFAFIPHTEGSRLCLIIGACIAFLAGLSSISRINIAFVNPHNRS